MYTKQQTKKAVYIGIQKGLVPEEDFPLFNIIWEGHPLHGSTVDTIQLESLGIEIPQWKINNKGK